MRYFSTRGEAKYISSAQAILQGLAADGGLFVPENIPQITPDFIDSLKDLSYQQRAEKIISLFLTDYNADEIKKCIANAYTAEKFDTDLIAPAVKVKEGRYVLELWHGPTSAFKDMALQMLPQFISTALRKEDKKEELLILVATSGDTGKAALEGFKDVPQTGILVFYPQEGVSLIQKAQMVTQEGDNVGVVAIKGNFDDAQTGVKQIFNDVSYQRELAAANVELSSANSINWGRLLPQIVYYFSAYADLVKAGEITMGEVIDFSVPTGNFGNILAGFYAKKMGLPIGNLLCASNENNVLTDFLKTGIYSRNREFHKTISPSMDILISSNLERLLYHITGDTEKVKNWMEELNTKGSYKVDEDTLKAIQNTFRAGYLNDEDTRKNIGELYNETGYIMDPHTSVAWSVAKDENSPRKTVILSTASPYKFNDSVLEALGIDTDEMSEFEMLDKLAEINKDPIPAGLNKLRQAEVKHDVCCDKADMLQQVNAFLQG